MKVISPIASREAGPLRRKRFRRPAPFKGLAIDLYPFPFSSSLYLLFDPKAV